MVGKYNQNIWLLVIILTTVDDFKFNLFLYVHPVESISFNWVVNLSYKIMIYLMININSGINVERYYE